MDRDDLDPSPPGEQASTRMTGAGIVPSMMRSNHEFETPLSPTEVVRRIESLTAPPGNAFTRRLGMNMDYPLRGYVTPGGFRITRNTKGLNSWRPVAEGAVLGRPSGSLVTVNFRLDERVRIVQISFLAVWASLMTLVSATAIVSGRLSALMPVVVLVLIAGQAIAAYRAGRLSGGKQRAEILDILCQRLDLHRVETQG